MTFTRMAWLDRWIGRPICLTLTALRRAGALFPHHKCPTAAPRKILFIKLIEQGATVLAAPAIARAIELVGAGKVYFLVFEENRPILDLMDMLPRDNILSLRSTSILTFVIDVLSALRKAPPLLAPVSSAELPPSSGVPRRLLRLRSPAPPQGRPAAGPVERRPPLHPAQSSTAEPRSTYHVAGRQCGEWIARERFVWLEATDVSRGNCQIFET